MKQLLDDVELDTDAQADVAAILRDPLLALLPQRESYNTRLLKVLIDAIERDQGRSISDELVEQLAALLTCGLQIQPQVGHPTDVTSA